MTDVWMVSPTARVYHAMRPGRHTTTCERCWFGVITGSGQPLRGVIVPEEAAKAEGARPCKDCYSREATDA